MFDLAIDLFRKVRSVTDGLVNTMTGVGTNADKSQAAYWATNFFGREELTSAFRASWVCKQIVTSVAEDMVREWVAFNEEDQPFEDECERLDLREHVLVALIWARLYGGSLMVIWDGDDLEMPCDHTRPIVALRVFDRWEVAPSSTRVLEPGPYFGLPQWYQIVDITTGMTWRVHCSRCIRFDGELLPRREWVRNQWWHASSLEHVLTTITRNENVQAAIATMIDETNVDVLSVEGLEKKIALPGGTASVQARYAAAFALKSHLRMLILDKKEEYQKKSASFDGLHNIMMAEREEVCGASDICYSRLYGRSPGGLNATGDSDLQNYWSMIGSKQSRQLRPRLQQVFVWIKNYTSGGPEKGFKWTFKPLFVLPEDLQEQTKFQRAQSRHLAIQDMVITPAQALQDIVHHGDVAGVTQADVDDLKQLALQPAPAVDPITGEVTRPLPAPELDNDADEDDKGATSEGDPDEGGQTGTPGGEEGDG